MTKTGWLDQDEARTWRSYILMNQLLQAKLERELHGAAGLSGADYGVLVELSEAPGHRLRVGMLAKRLVWSKSRTSHQLARMESRGLVTREGCSIDARGTEAVLTHKGLREIERAAPAHVDAVRRNFFDHVTDEQLATLADIAETVVARLQPECDVVEV